MTDIAKLQVLIEAESSRLQTELEKTNKKLDRFGNKAKKSLGNFSTAAKAALGVFTVGAISTAIERAVDFADSIDKASKAAGVSAEFLQEMRFAADQNGVSMAGLDDSMRRFNRRLGEFINSGGGPAQKALEALNISVTDMEGNVRSTEDVFRDTVVALRDVETTAQKSALAAQLFGDDFGPKLVTLLDQGIDGIDALAQAARDSGQVLDESVIGNAVAAKDAMAKLSGQFTSVANTIILQMAPSLEDLAEYLGRNLPQAVEAIGQTFQAFRHYLLEAAEGVNEFIGGVASYYAAIADFFGADEVSQSLKNVADGYKDSARQIDELQLSYALATDEVKNFNKEREKGAGFTQLGVGAGDAAKAAEAEKEAAKEREKAQKEADKLREEQRKNEQKYREELEATAKAIQEQVNPIQALGEELAKLDELLAEGLISWETYGEAVFQAQESFDDLNDKAKDATDEVSTYAEEAARNIQDSFADFLFDPFDQGIQGMLDGFVDMLRKMAAEKAASQILEGLEGSSAFSGFLNFIGLGGARAMGGPVAAGTPYLVGERNKPEIFVPNTAGKIVPQIGGGGNTNVTVNIQGGTDGSRESANQIGLSVARAIQKAQKRNG